MKDKKGLFALIFTGCLLLFTGFYISRSLEAKLEELGGTASAGKLSVSVKNQLDSGNAYGFTESEMNKLARSLDSAAIGYSSQMYLTVGYGNQTAESCVIGTNCQYRGFSDISIKRGSFFSDADDGERNPVAVVDEELAWHLFNNDEVIGCFIDIAGSKFKIIGVAGHDGSTVSKLTGNGGLRVYVPFGAFIELKSDAKIDHFIVNTGVDGTTGRNMEIVGNALLAIGKNPEHYMRIDQDVQHAINRQKPQIVLFFMGMMIILALLRFIGAKLAGLIKDIRAACKFDYFSSVLRQYHRDLFSMLFLMLLSAGGIVVLWQLIRFKVYISPELIPDDIADFTYYPKLIQQILDRNALNAGYMAPYDEMMRSTGEALLNWIFYPAILLGLMLFYFGMTGMRKAAASLTAVMLLCGVFLITSMALGLLFTRMMGVEPVMDIKAILILWGFIVTNLLLFTNTKEGRRFIATDA